LHAYSWMDIKLKININQIQILSNSNLAD